MDIRKAAAEMLQSVSTSVNLLRLGRGWSTISGEYVGSLSIPRNWQLERLEPRSASGMSNGSNINITSGHMDDV
jgi:hypothetical protein